MREAALLNVRERNRSWRVGIESVGAHLILINYKIREEIRCRIPVDWYVIINEFLGAHVRTEYSGKKSTRQVKRVMTLAVKV
jgi:hypothetical protein